MKLRFSAALIAAFVTLGASAQAQIAPGKQVRVVVPFAAGGTADIVARLLTQSAAVASGLSFIVESRPGAGTVTATEAVSRAAPDGTTLLVMAPSFVINSSLRPNLTYDPRTSFDPICKLIDSPQVFVVNAASDYKTFKDFADAAKAKPGTLAYGSNGPATTQHIGGEMLKRGAKLDLIYVPFGGGAPAVNALLGGHVAAVLANYSEVVEQINGGKLRPLGTSTVQRLAELKDVPTLIESGVADFDLSAWFGIVAPAKTPPETLAQLTALFKAALQAPDVKSKLVAQGLYPADLCGQAYGDYIKSEYSLYARVVKDVGMKAD